MQNVSLPRNTPFGVRLTARPEIRLLRHRTRVRAPAYRAWTTHVVFQAKQGPRNGVYTSGKGRCGTKRS